MNKVALITGTTSGIGKAFAEKLAHEQYDLILVSRDGNKLSEQARQLTEKYGIGVFDIPVNLLEKNAVQKVFEVVQKLGITVQVLINNAGFNEYGIFTETDLQNEINMIHLHTVVTTEMMKIFLPQMIKNKYGRILNLGSTGSYMACPYDAVYAATKAYILSVSKGINAELKGTGVSVTTLCPGSTNTAFARKAKMEKTLLFKLFVMSPDAVASIGYHALMKKRVSVVAGFYNKLMVFFSKILPSKIALACAKTMLKTE